MTADPDCVAPDVDATAAFASLAEHGYRHIPVVDGDRLVGIVSMRDVMRVAQIQPAEQPRARSAARPRGCRRRGDVDRRRAGARGLLPLPPVQRGRARREAHARRRLAPHVRGPAAVELEERAAFQREIAPLREIPAPVKSRAPRPRRGGGQRPARSPAHHGVAHGRVAGFRPSLDVDADRAPRQAMQAVRRGSHAAHRAVPAPAGSRDRRSRSRARLRRELPVHDARRGTTSPSTRGRSSSTS